jgi:hypothetical protein
MKRFNFPHQQDWYKWTLAGALIASLGVCMSFNPDTKFIARNEFNTRGTLALASQNLRNPIPPPPVVGPTDPNLPSAPSVDNTAPLSDQAVVVVPLFDDNSVVASGKYDAASKKITWKIFKKANPNDQGATLCVDCFYTAIETGENALHSMDTGNLTTLSMFTAQLQLKAAALQTLVLLPQNGSDGAHPEIAAIDKQQVVINDMYKSSCAKPHRGDADGGLDTVVECQRNELDGFVSLCQERVDDSKATVQECRNMVLNYYEKNVKSIIAKGLSADPTSDDHKAALNLISLFLGGTDGIDGVIPTEWLSTSIAKDVDLMAKKADLALIGNTYNDFLKQELQNAQAMGCPQGPQACVTQAANAARADTSTYIASLSQGSYDPRNRTILSLGDMKTLSAVSTSLGGQYSSIYQQSYASPMQAVMTAASTPSQQPTQAMMPQGQFGQPQFGQQNQFGQPNQFGQSGVPSIGSPGQMQNGQFGQPGQMQQQQQQAPFVNFAAILAAQQNDSAGLVQQQGTVPGMNNFSQTGRNVPGIGGPVNGQNTMQPGVNTLNQNNGINIQSLMYSPDGTYNQSYNPALPQQQQQQNNGLPRIN